jgi:hypothetical protein
MAAKFEKADSGKQYLSWTNLMLLLLMMMMVMMVMIQHKFCSKELSFVLNKEEEKKKRSWLVFQKREESLYHGLESGNFVRIECSYIRLFTTFQ